MPPGPVVGWVGAPGWVVGLPGPTGGCGVLICAASALSVHQHWHKTWNEVVISFCGDGSDRFHQIAQDTFLWLAAWLWIILASARAGGDQWDNPRYRVILLMFQVAPATYAWLWARQKRDRWLGRILAVEGVFLVLFGYWYFSRYMDLKLQVINIFVVFAAIAIIGLVILIGSWFWDRRRARRSKKDVQ